KPVAKFSAQQADKFAVPAHRAHCAARTFLEERRLTEELSRTQETEGFRRKPPVARHALNFDFAADNPEAVRRRLALAEKRLSGAHLAQNGKFRQILEERLRQRGQQM